MSNPDFHLQKTSGKKSNVETLRYGQAIYRNGVKISFHSADPILGSAQIRIEYKGKIQ
ncbi:hypothetical protein [Leptospira alexanderi]|uniref:hypothetical protein n=1 Tax=Leptospira alexanderi TaxID=100053 RepID=UPI00147CF5B6|nr:hypothetical protein [Leptospira alexanderi]